MIHLFRAYKRREVPQRELIEKGLLAIKDPSNSPSKPTKPTLTIQLEGVNAGHIKSPSSVRQASGTWSVKGTSGAVTSRQSGTTPMRMSGASTSRRPEGTTA